MNLKTPTSSSSALNTSVPRRQGDLTQKQPRAAAWILFLFHTILYKELNVFGLLRNYIKMKWVVQMGENSICCCKAVKGKKKASLSFILQTKLNSWSTRCRQCLLIRSPWSLHQVPEPLSLCQENDAWSLSGCHIKLHLAVLQHRKFILIPQA